MNKNVTLPLFLFLFLIFIGANSYAQLPPSSSMVCATSGGDGTTNINGSINTYFPPVANITLSAASKNISLSNVPSIDAYGNNFGTISIKSGDLLLLIQTQDALINYTNTTFYGGNNSISGADQLGATGFTNLGNSGKFEYVMATNDVPLTGGVLQFTGSGAGGGAVYTYTNADASITRGKQSFQVIRIPQYANLRLTSNISPPPFNGKAGGVIAFEVSGNMDFNGFNIDVSARGFRGGYSLIKNAVTNISDLYVTIATDDKASGKGEGIAGTPRYMWDGFNEVDNILEGLPGGSAGRGAPANAGGGGNDTNAGGGGGGNGDSGGVGAWGYEPFGGSFPSGGRPGSKTYTGALPADATRLIMGGGGGGGHANDALTGVKGGVGGGIIIINSRTISGAGTILANGADGAPGVYGSHPDGSGGGGAGGSVFLKVSNPSPTANITVQAKGGKGGNTEGDSQGGIEPHGPGGGAGGGVIIYSIPSGQFHNDVTGGDPGKTNSGNGITHHAEGGLSGKVIPLNVNALPPYLMSNNTICFPLLTTTLNIVDAEIPKMDNGTANYIIKITNDPSAGNAAGVQADCQLPTGFSFNSATVTFSGAATGSATIINNGTAVRPLMGDFIVPAGSSVIINVLVNISCVTSGTYNTSAQAIYFDPTRDYTSPNRHITPKTNAFAGSNTTYQTTSFGNVGGLNYNGSTSTTEDAIVTNATFIVNNIAQLTPDPPFCTSGDPTVITGSTPTGGNGTYTYQWQSAADNVTFTDITGATSKDFDPPGIFATTYYRRAITSGSCTTPLVSNVATITVLPASANNTITAPAITSFCTTANADLITGSTPTGGNGVYNYQWQISSDNINYTAIVSAIFKDYDPPVNNITSYYRRLVTSGTCVVPLLSNIITITVSPLPSTPVLVNAAPLVCPGNNTTLQISSPQTGISYNWYSTADKTNLLITGISYNTDILTTSKTYYVEASNNTCTSPLAVVQVNMAPVPAAPVLINNPMVICIGTTATLQILNPQNGFTYNWYNSASGITPVHIGESFIVLGINAPTTYYAETVNAGRCISDTRTAVTVTPIALPMVTVADVEICPGTSAILTAVGTNTGDEILWYSSATSTTPLQANQSKIFTTQPLSSTTDFYLEVINSNNCKTPVSVKVTAKLLQMLDAPVVTVDHTTTSSILFKWNEIADAKSYQVSINGGQTFTEPSSGSNGLTHSITNLQADQKITILVQAVGVSNCELSGSSTAVTGSAVSEFNQVYVANAFTPNGDGNNDVVYVHGERIKTLSFYIYDQWGELLFTSTDINKGWDGYYKGTREPVGVYVYFLKAVMNNGAQLNKKGTVTLLR